MKVSAIKSLRDGRPQPPLKVEPAVYTTIHVTQSLKQRLRQQADRRGMKMFEYADRTISRAVEIDENKFDDEIDEWFGHDKIAKQSNSSHKRKGK